MARKKADNAVAVGNWLVLGSFPMTDTARGRWLSNGYEAEADFAPNSGEEFNGRRWKAYEGDVIGFHDRPLAFAHREWCYAYAFVYIKSPSSRKVKLLIGSDDGFRAWLNGVAVKSVDTQRSLSVDEDRVAVTLRKGWNGLLVKVAQGTGDWGLSVRVGGATATSRTPSVSFSTKRPSVKQFPGLRKRKVGLVLGGAPSIGVDSSSGELGFTFGLSLFNDSVERATRVKVAVVGAGGVELAKGSSKPIGPFAAADVSVTAAGPKLLEALGSGAKLRLVTTCSSGEVSAPLPADVAPRLFALVMTGFDLEARPDAELAAPTPFRGAPALAEIRPESEAHMPRGVGWPKMPRRVVSAEETAAGGVVLGLEPPLGLPHPRARITFGDERLVDLAKRVRFVMAELSAEVDTSAVSELGREGLTALAEGDLAAASSILGRFYDKLSASAADRKDQVITLSGHAHIDMNWLWVSSETAQCCHDTFRQVLSFMDEFPEFTFSQSQSSTYRYVEEQDPQMFERIRQRVAEGRWELLGGMVDEGDTNLSSGEGLARTLLYGQRYYMEKFGRRALVGWLPDNFGHVAQLPQILRLSGIRYFYGHRCMPTQGPFVWEGVDGSCVLNFVTPTYNGAVTPELRHFPEQYDPMGKRLLWVYGVGDHGGGPTRRDIEAAIEYNDMPGFPRFEFGTCETFYRSIESDADKYEVHKGELQYIFEGCYTSIARVKEGNRRCENTLYDAELVSALAALEGHPYPAEAIYDAWYDVCYNQFHDILCGSAIHESNRESIGRYDAALAEAEGARYGGLRALAARVPTKSDRGQPVVVFNQLGRSRTDVVGAEVFSHLAPPMAELGGWGHWMGMQPRPIDVGQGPYATMHLEDETGRVIDAQIVDGKLFPNGYRIKVRFLAEDVPACGVRLYYVRPDQPGYVQDGSLTVDGTTIETPHLRVEIDKKTGHVVSIYDRARRKEVLDGPANVLKIYMEEPHGMSAWNLGPITETHTLDKAESVRVVENGPVRATIEVEREWNRSRFKQKIIVYRDVPRVEFELDVRWFELGGPDVDAPTLRVGFPLRVSGGAFCGETPFAVCRRSKDGQETPAQKWVDLSGRGGGAALLSDSKYGHRCTDATVETTLLRASYDPDLYPDQGPHKIRYALLPHKGDWVAGGVHEEGVGFNLPLLSVETPPGQGGDLPSGAGLISVDPDNVFLSCVKRAEEGESLIIRFYEAHGCEAEAVVNLPKNVMAVSRVNLLEEPLEGVVPAMADGSRVRVSVKPHEVVTLKVTL